MVVVECWPFTREISDNRRRKCLQIPDYYRKCSYDAHTRIVYIYKVSSYRIGIYEKFTHLRSFEVSTPGLAIARIRRLTYPNHLSFLLFHNLQYVITFANPSLHYCVRSSAFVTCALSMGYADVSGMPEFQMPICFFLLQTPSSMSLIHTIVNGSEA